MLELLAVELNRVGLHLNTSKAKLLTTSSLEHPLYIDGCGDLLAVLWGEEKHKHLGRTMRGLCRTTTPIANWLGVFSQTQSCFDKPTHCLTFAFEIVCCRHLSCNLVWFGYPAFDQN